MRPVWREGSAAPVAGAVISRVGWENRGPPPHFHAAYGEFKATIDIRGLRIADGSLPRRAAQLVLDWTELHQVELLEDWDLCQAKQHPKPIAPLQ